MLLADILNKLQKVKVLGKGEYQACCPSHDDKKPSLNLKQDGDRILLKCQAGCATESIVQSLGLQMADLFVESETSPKVMPVISATYDYLDESGDLLFQVVRYVPKAFRQRHKNGSGEWVWNLDGVRRILYHLPDILNVTTETIYLVEGEKDVDNLLNWGQIATTSPQGASAWKVEYADFLKGKRVVVIPDKDDAGYNYARQVAKSLQGKCDLKTIILPDPAKDVSDWLEAGGDVQILPSLEQDISILFNQAKLQYRQDIGRIYWDRSIRTQIIRFQAEKLSEERTGIHARITISLDTPLSWSYLNIERREDRSSLAGAAHQVIEEELKKSYSKDDLRRDLDTFCAGLWDYHTSLLSPEMVEGDGELEPLEFYLSPYLLCGGGSILYSPPGRGKSYTGQLWAVCVDAGINLFWPVHQTRVLFINLERSKKSVTRRLAMINRVLGLPLNRPLLMLNARGKSLNDVASACKRSIVENQVGLVILDSISRAGVGDLTENVSGNRVIDTLSSLCPSWLALGHTPRVSEGHLYGSIMQDAGADICIQLSSQTLDNGTLGVGWQITKQNDTGNQDQEVFAFEFGSVGLTGIRKAKPFEFPEIESRMKQSMEEIIMDFILEQEGADATATQIAEATGFNRQNISSYLAQSGKFIQTRRVKTSVYYGVKEGRETLLP